MFDRVCVCLAGWLVMSLRCSCVCACVCVGLQSRVVVKSDGSLLLCVSVFDFVRVCLAAWLVTGLRCCCSYVCVRLVACASGGSRV